MTTPFFAPRIVTTYAPTVPSIAFGGSSPANVVYFAGGGVAPQGPAGPVSVFNAVNNSVPADGSPASTAINALIALIAGAKATIYFPPGNYGLNANVTFPSNIQVWMEQGARFTATGAGVTLTILGNLLASLDLKFDYSVNAFTTTIRSKVLSPQWWGAIGDGVNDDAPPINAAILAVDTAGGRGGRVELGAGVFLCGSTVALRSQVKVVGAGRRATLVNYTGAAAAVSGANIIYSGISEARISLGASPTAIGVQLIAQVSSVQFNRFYELDVIGTDVAGQIGWSNSIVAGNILSPNWFDDIYIGHCHRSLVDMDSEGNTWLGLQIEFFGAAQVGALAIEARTHDNIYIGRIGNGAPIATSYAYSQTGERNFCQLVTDIGGLGSLNVTGLDNICMIQRPVGFTPIGVYNSSTTLIDGDNTQLKRISAGGTALVAADFALGAGFGSLATVSNVVGTDTRFTCQINSAGVGQAANPTVTLTFKDGVFPAAPHAVASRRGGNQLAVGILPFIPNPNNYGFLFAGLPVAGESYSFEAIIVG